MSDREDNNWGERLQDIVQDAVDTRDFDRLSRNIQDSIDDVFDEWKIGPGTAHFSGTNQGRYHYQGSAARGADIGDAVERRRTFTSSGRADRNYGSAGGAGYRQGTDLNLKNREGEVLHGTVEKKQNTEIQLYKQTVPGSYSGPACMIIGGIGTAVFGGLTLLCAGVLAALADPQGVGITTAVFLPMTAAFGGLTALGVSLRGRAQRFRTYVKTLAGRTYCKVDELAAAVNKNDAYVVKDLNKMIQKEFFLHGHMDRQNTTLMVDDETYRQYLETDKSYQARVSEENARRKEEENIFSTTGINDPDFIRTIQEGNDYIREIREANDKIPGEEISQKLYRLENILKKIFEVLKQKPDEMGRLRKFMNYYMPTTRKLVQTYQELDSQPVEGENIRKAKAEIEQAIETINNAYEKLLDSFYEDALMDIHTDRAVLESMLKEDGLSQNPFEVKGQVQQSN